VSFGTDTLAEIESTQRAGMDVAFDGQGVVCLTAVADEWIEPLPAACLPQTKKRTLKGIDDGDSVIQVAQRKN